MARFTDIVGGTAARRTREIDFGGEKPVAVDFRKLAPLEESLVYERAREYAVKRGVPDPRPGEPLYDFATRVHTMAFACVDHDSSIKEPQPFFESAQQIIDSQILSHDVVAYLFAEWEMFVDETSLQKKDLSVPDMLRLITSLAVGETLPFMRLAPSMQLHLARSMAARLSTLLAIKSPSSSPSEEPAEAPDDDHEGARASEGPPAG